jgi:hypothetical protein
MYQPQKPFSESGTSPPPLVTLTRIQIVPGSTVALGEGIDERGRAVSFAGDWRPMLSLAGALDAGDVVTVSLESWQVLDWGLS